MPLETPPYITCNTPNDIEESKHSADYLKEEVLQPSSEANELRVTLAHDSLELLGDSYVRRSPVGIPPLLPT
jgi:hypothetical protein